MATATAKGIYVMMPRVCILKTDGINCDQETQYACQRAHADAEVVHINELRNKNKMLRDYQMLILPGGFSYGDDVASGKILALEMISFLQDQLSEFVVRDTLVLGICNGFQVLAKMGLLPANNVGNTIVTLIDNDSGLFMCKWVTLTVEQSACVFAQQLNKKQIMLPIAHAEGKFFAANATINKIENNNQVVLRYADANPNGAINAIAGVCDTTGRIFGLMPHPERFVHVYQYPNWRRTAIQPFGLSFFTAAVDYLKEA